MALKQELCQVLIRLVSLRYPPVVVYFHYKLDWTQNCLECKALSMSVRVKGVSKEI